MLVQTADDFQKALNLVSGASIFGIDTETNGLNSFKGNRLVGVSLYAHGSPSFYLPFRHGTGENLPLEWLHVLIDTLNHAEGTAVGWNMKFDLHMFAADGYHIPFEGRVEDAMLAAHLMNENEPNFQLKNTADRYGIGVGSKDEEDLRTYVMGIVPGLRADSTKWKGHMWKLDPAIVSPYAETDAVLTLQLRDFYYPFLQQWELESLYREMNDYMLIATRMEQRGILLDIDKIHEYQEEAEEQTERSLFTLRKTVGNPVFNPGSVPQLRKAFGWPTTREDYLVEQTEDPNAKLVLDYRKWSKVDSSYYTVYLNACDSNHVLRPNFNVIGTISGRWSCLDPNLQAVPPMGEIYKVKDTMVARPGYELLELDLSQAELRIASFFAEEHIMAEILARGGDLHQEVSELISVPRTTAKRINFSSVYGIGAATFARKYHMEEQLARQYLTRWHAKFRGFKRLYYNMSDLAEKQGYIRLGTGRVRRYRINGQVVAEYHKASSNLVQGTVAEVMRIAMRRCAVAMRKMDVHMLLNIHDAILFEIPLGSRKEVVPIVASLMTDFALDPPMSVEAKAGPTWGEMKKVEVPLWAIWRPSKYLPGAIRPKKEELVLA